MGRDKFLLQSSACQQGLRDDVQYVGGGTDLTVPSLNSRCVQIFVSHSHEKKVSSDNPDFVGILKAAKCDCKVKNKQNLQSHIQAQSCEFKID